MLSCCPLHCRALHWVNTRSNCVNCKYSDRSPARNSFNPLRAAVGRHTVAQRLSSRPHTTQHSFKPFPSDMDYSNRNFATRVHFNLLSSSNCDLIAAYCRLFQDKWPAAGRSAGRGGALQSPPLPADPPALQASLPLLQHVQPRLGQPDRPGQGTENS